MRAIGTETREYRGVGLGTRDAKGENREESSSPGQGRTGRARHLNSFVLWRPLRHYDTTDSALYHTLQQHRKTLPNRNERGHTIKSLRDQQTHWPASSTNGTRVGCCPAGFSLLQGQLLLHHLHHTGVLPAGQCRRPACRHPQPTYLGTLPYPE